MCLVISWVWTELAPRLRASHNPSGWNSDELLGRSSKADLHP